MRNPILVALDFPSVDVALALARELAPVVGGFKIGNELLLRPARRRSGIRATGASVFLDPKFHDIPNTVAKAVAAATRLDVQMATVHTSGGTAMLKAAEKSALETAQSLGRPAPGLLGVTVLTSMDSNELGEVGFQPNAGRQVERLAALAVQAGLRGLVCSPLELADLRQLVPKAMQLVTPGIRAVTDRPTTRSAP